MMKFYRLADHIPVDERERLGVPEVRTHQNSTHDGKYIRSVRTEYFREPKKGEWYLSGATPMAYRAPNDLSTRYQIMRLVVVERKTKVVYKDVTP